MGYAIGVFMLKKKGASHVLWFVLAFVIILIIITISILILKQGEGYAFKGIEDVFKKMGDMIT